MRVSLYSFIYNYLYYIIIVYIISLFIVYRLSEYQFGYVTLLNSRLGSTRIVHNIIYSEGDEPRESSARIRKDGILHDSRRTH